MRKNAVKFTVPSWAPGACSSRWVLILRSIYKFTISWATNCFKRSRYCPYSSTSLCPAPSTQSGSTGRWQRSYKASPWEKSITSSSVPWITSTGEVTLEILSMLKKKKQKTIEQSVRQYSVVNHHYVIYKVICMRDKGQLYIKKKCFFVFFYCCLKNTIFL